MNPSYSILLSGDRKLEGITFSAQSGDWPSPIEDELSLQFLSVVEVSRIPLYLAIGSPCSVFTSSSSTENWFRNIFLKTETHNDRSPWWEAASRDSPLGVLVGFNGYHNDLSPSQPRVTELLFYASNGHNAATRLPTPGSSPPFQAKRGTNETKPEARLRVKAIALSSDLFHTAQNTERTPPPSPLAKDAEIDAHFLPRPFSAETKVINEPPVRKRKSAADAFDQASERRQKARKKGGEGVSAAASGETESQIATLKHCRSDSNMHPVPRQTKPFSRSPSVASSRPQTAGASRVRSSTLSRVQSVTASDASEFETKNKDIVSRIVMACMRLHGLSQSKSRKSRSGSSIPSPSVDTTFEEIEAERKNDEEYKLIYHQAFKGTCFAFRSMIAEQNLQPFSEAIRDTADKLLTIFCSNPLTNIAERSMHEVTPIGWNAFTPSLR